MTALWHVLSRGVGAKHDYYTWAGVGEGPGLTPDEVDDLVAEAWPGHRLEDLLDDERSSLLLFHHGTTGLVLIVTGLFPADAPLDFHRRTIRAAVLGRATQKDDYDDIIGMTVLGLREQIARHLPLSWTEAAKLGFRVDSDGWAKLLHKARDVLRGGPQKAPDGQPAAGAVRLDTEAAREAAAGGLIDRYLGGGLPGRRIIVLRTSRVDAFQLRDLNPWQGLTTDPDVRRLGEKPAVEDSSLFDDAIQLGAQAISRSFKFAQQQARRNPLGFLLLLIVLAGVAAGTYALVRRTAPAQPRPSVTATATATHPAASPVRSSSSGR